MEQRKVAVPRKNHSITQNKNATKAPQSMGPFLRFSTFVIMRHLNLFGLLSICFLFSSFHQKKTPKVTIAASSMNLLYDNINNPISIYTDGNQNENLVVTATGECTLTRIEKDGHHYLLRTNGTKRETRINVVLKNKKGKSVSLANHTFRIRPLPRPIAQLGGLPNDGLDKPASQVKAQSVLIATYGASFPYNLNAKVISYEAQIISRTENVTLAAKTNRIPAEITEKMKNLQPGDLVIFKAILLETPVDKGTIITNSPPIVITLK